MYFVRDMVPVPLRKFRWITEIGCVLLLIACKVPADAQQHFMILFQDRPIGQIEASRQGSEADRILSIRSSVRVKLLLNYQLNTRIETEYRNGSLLKAVSWKKSNHSPSNSAVSTLKVPGGYEVRSDAGSRSLLVAGIAFCVAGLYFTEPAAVREVYSETEGALLPMAPIEPHVYRLEKPDRPPNYFYYGNGRLLKVETRIKFGTLEFLKTDTP